MTLDFTRWWSKPPEWFEHAACRGMGPDLFFPKPGENNHAAHRVCRKCPVVDDCLAMGKREPYGIWGGRTKHGTQAPTYVEPTRHGTDNGYAWHLRHGVPPCDDCRRAHNAKNAAHRAKQQGAA